MSNGNVYGLRDRLADIVDNECGMQPVMSGDELLTMLERRLFVLRCEGLEARRYARAWKALAKLRGEMVCVLRSENGRLAASWANHASQLRGMDELADHRAAELRKLRDGVRALAATVDEYERWELSDRLRALLEGT